MNIGINAGPGIARRNCSEGFTKSERLRERPIKIPNGMPIRTARAQPPSGAVAICVGIG